MTLDNSKFENDQKALNTLVFAFNTSIFHGP